MKRVIVFIWAAAVMFLITVIPCFAETVPACTEETARQLISDAHDVEYSLNGSFQWFEEGKNYNDVISTSVGPDEGSVVRYGVVKAGYTPDEVTDLIKRTFTKRAATVILDSIQFARMSNGYKVIDGRTYHGFIIALHGLDSYEHDIAKDGMFSLTDHGDGTAKAELETVRTDYENYMTPGSETVTTDVILVYEDGAWKVDGGSFFTRFALLTANPGTSDPGVFAATVVIALALAAVLKKRKKLVDFM